MPINRVLAGVAVADVDSATRWYERLLGPPPTRSHGRPGRVVLPADRRDPGGPGHRPRWAIPADLRRGRSRERARSLRERGLDPGAMDDTTSDKVLFATVTDPEGNAITLVGQR
jgi:hypothetical protein